MALADNPQLTGYTEVVVPNFTELPATVSDSNTNIVYLTLGRGDKVAGLYI